MGFCALLCGAEATSVRRLQTSTELETQSATHFSCVFAAYNLQHRLCHIPSHCPTYRLELLAALAEWLTIHPLMACGCASRFALVQSYGQLQEPGLAVKAFDECWRLGHWKHADVKTANALLNALHTDPIETYNRYSS